VTRANDIYEHSENAVGPMYKKYRGTKELREKGVILVNNQLDALFSMFLFISLLYTFRATQCSSSGESIVSIHHLVYITLHR